MQLDRDEFIINYDSAQISDTQLIALIKAAGYSSEIVTETIDKSSDGSVDSPEQSPGSRNAPFFVEALARAKQENKPLLLDFYAEWCPPCKKMLKSTFPDPQVAPLLEKFVFLKVDTDQHPELAKSFQVAALPDIRFLDPSGNEFQKLLDFQDAKSFRATLEKVLANEALTNDAK